MPEPLTYESARRMVPYERRKVCTIALHPPEGCVCGAFAKEQCCDRLSCQMHRCGPRVGCRCPQPAGVPSA